MVHKRWYLDIICPDGSEHVWQMGVESLQGRVMAAQSWPLFQERKKYLRRLVPYVYWPFHHLCLITISLFVFELEPKSLYSMGSNDTEGITDTQGLFFWAPISSTSNNSAFSVPPLQFQNTNSKVRFQKGWKILPKFSTYNQKHPFGTFWSALVWVLLKIFVLAISSDVMFAICSSNLGCCTNWSNIMILNVAYLAFLANWKIWLNLAYFSQRWCSSTAWVVGLVWATQAWFCPNTQTKILTSFFSASHRWYLIF